MNQIEENLQKYGWTPLHTRIISHRIGDGTVNFYGHYVWDNKHTEDFVELSKYLGIRLWGPINSDKWGTQKITINKKIFQTFGKIVNEDPKKLLKEPTFLLNSIQNLPKEHQIQTLFALIVDDGCFKNWMMVLFEDQHQEIIQKVYELWDNLFPKTAKISFCTTKSGTKVYHIMVNRNGIIKLKEELDQQQSKYGQIAGLWRKQEDFNHRYQKAVSKRARELNDTKESKEEKKVEILKYLDKHKSITFTKVKEHLNLSPDRARLITEELLRENRIFLTSAGNRARYNLETEDNSLEHRQGLIIGFI